jgi:hypothetical protein
MTDIEDLPQPYREQVERIRELADRIKNAVNGRRFASTDSDRALYEQAIREASDEIDDIHDQWLPPGAGEWVPDITWTPDDRCPDLAAKYALIEAGGIYPEKAVIYPPGMGRSGRLFVTGEHEVACPNCGRRFAKTGDASAAANRDMHFDGDEDLPSICR